jgi:hypothetical protein
MVGRGEDKTVNFSSIGERLGREGGGEGRKGEERERGIHKMRTSENF